ncbi:hypothetical protein RHMOL_Rhmol09G0086600 [Rhododendron molle]|uniref:Uncharacterized protein n=1 Tax=Rhododendron molle TaxID=49168 RepID=A0ACC0MBF8_RHOML|nr:hypothetical protein RHMOL_Rhmol09G0086600 [Rhododendron molle]
MKRVPPTVSARKRKAEQVLSSERKLDKTQGRRQRQEVEVHSEVEEDMEVEQHAQVEKDVEVEEHLEVEEDEPHADLWEDEQHHNFPQTPASETEPAAANALSDSRPNAAAVSSC